MTKRRLLVLAVATAALTIRESLENNVAWPVLAAHKPLGNERSGKRKAGKSRYEPPKFG